MSFEAAAWAIKQKTKTATEKLVLITLADAQNSETNRCFPSIPTIAQVALCSERQAKRCIQSLESQGLIKVKREQGKSNYYSLSIKTSDAHDTSDNMTPVTCRDELVTPKVKVVTPTVRTSDTHDTLISNNQELTKNKSKSKKITISDFESIGIPKDIAEDFFTLRKTKKAPITKTAMNGIAREAQKAGLTLTECLKIMVERNWQGFKADWILENKQKSFKQQDQERAEAEALKFYTGQDDF